MGITINPSDTNTYSMRTTNASSVNLSIAEIKSKIGCGNFILFWYGNAYSIARLNDSNGDIYLCDNLHVGLSPENDIIFVNGTEQKERFLYVYDVNNSTFVRASGVGLNFSSKTYNSKMYIYYPVADAQHPQIGIFTSFGALYINNEPYVIRATLKVTYSIPQDTYTYCKLTYKEDYMPESESDGTSIDILPNETMVNVEGLEENKLYYFAIFTDKSESPPIPFKVQ